MSTTNQDFTVTEGETRTLLVPLTFNGAPYTVPGGSNIEWWASPSQFDAAGSVPIKRTNAQIGVVTAGGQSSVSIPIFSSDTIGRGQRKLFHQCRITLSSGVVVPLFSGIMTVVKRLIV